MKKNKIKNFEKIYSNPSYPFFSSVSSYYDYLKKNPPLKIQKESFYSFSVEDKIIPFLEKICAVKIGQDGLVKIDQIDKSLIYFEQTEKYLFYLFYRNFPNKPSWITNFNKGYENVLNKDADEILSRRPYILFKEIGLLDTSIEENIEWIEDAKKYSNKLKNEDEYEKKIIGDKGEKLSIKYEELRKCAPERVSLKNETLGYDILSQLDQNRKKDIMYIEVKTSTRSIESSEAIITKNETIRAKILPNYFFHFWDISEEEKPKLAILESSEITDEAPTEEKTKSGKLKDWTLPFKKFEKNFQSINFQ